MTHFSDAAHLDPCRYCRWPHRRSEMIAVKRLPGTNPRSKGYACTKCARMRGYKSPKQNTELALDFTGGDVVEQ